MYAVAFRNGMIPVNGAPFLTLMVTEDESQARELQEFFYQANGADTQGIPRYGIVTIGDDITEIDPVPTIP